ncbi:LemA family protein [Ectothiorhodospiraceae bacterium BW-2]|nr:LemA family protein [Ectothiorhodospiraceae bacterium BW-2]
MADYAPNPNERIRVSQQRLRELYHEEVNRRFHVPKMPAVRTIMVVSFLMLLFLTATFLFKYNSFVTMQEEVYAKYGHLQGAFQRRSNLFENLLKLTLNHAALEHAVFSHVADVRKQIIKKLQLPPEVEQSLQQTLVYSDNPQLTDIGDALSAMESGGLEASIGRLLGLVENYPDIKSSETYAHMMSSLVEIEDRIADRRMIYQETILMFNREISRFPWYMLAKLTEFERFDYFHAEEGADRRPEIHSDHFEMLLPVVSSHGAHTGSSKEDRAESKRLQTLIQAPQMDEPEEALAGAIPPDTRVEPKPRGGDEEGAVVIQIEDNRGE